jgi:hypothetical protein
MSKRIRFGLIFVGPPPAKDGEFLCGLGIKHIEGCDMGEKRFVLFALDKARKAADVLRAVEEHNLRFPTAELDEELLMASDGMLTSAASAIMLLPCGGGDPGATTKRGSAAKVAVFDKGHAFQSHEIFRVICAAKVALAQVQPPPVPDDLFGQTSPFRVGEFDRPCGYWSWGSLDDVPPPPPSSAGQKRAINALASDLVEESIKPSAPKRVSFVPELEDACTPVAAGVDASTDDIFEQQVYFCGVFGWIVSMILHLTAAFVGRLGVCRLLRRLPRGRLGHHPAVRATIVVRQGAQACRGYRPSSCVSCLTSPGRPFRPRISLSIF